MTLVLSSDLETLPFSHYTVIYSVQQLQARSNIYTTVAPSTSPPCRPNHKSSKIYEGIDHIISFQYELCTQLSHPLYLQK